MNSVGARRAASLSGDDFGQSCPKLSPDEFFFLVLQLPAPWNLCCFCFAGVRFCRAKRAANWNFTTVANYLFSLSSPTSAFMFTRFIKSAIEDSRPCPVQALDNRRQQQDLKIIIPKDFFGLMIVSLRDLSLWFQKNPLSRYWYYTISEC